MALNNKKSKITLKENNIFAKWRISNPNVEIVKNTNNQDKSQTNNFSGNIGGFEHRAFELYKNLH